MPKIDGSECLRYTSVFDDVFFNGLIDVEDLAKLGEEVDEGIFGEKVFVEDDEEVEEVEDGGVVEGDEVVDSHFEFVVHGLFEVEGEAAESVDGRFEVVVGDDYDAGSVKVTQVEVMDIPIFLQPLQENLQVIRSNVGNDDVSALLLSLLKALHK